MRIRDDEIIYERGKNIIHRSVTEVPGGAADRDRPRAGMSADPGEPQEAGPAELMLPARKKKQPEPKQRGNLH
jgi:hypothetical protein